MNGKLVFLEALIKKDSCCFGGNSWVMMLSCRNTQKTTNYLVVYHDLLAPPILRLIETETAKYNADGLPLVITPSLLVGLKSDIWRNCQKCEMPA